jgi:hypothetical protein
MPHRFCLILAFIALLGSANNSAFAQGWSFDARDMALGGVGATRNLSSKMIDEQRDYTSITLPLGLIQVLKDRDVYDPSSPKFNPILTFEYAANPVVYVIGREDRSPGEVLFVSDLRNATLSRDLSKYKGLVFDNAPLAEGLVTPNFGHTFKVKQGSGGAFQGVYVGAGPYLTLHDSALISPGLTNVFATGVNVANAHFPIVNDDLAQLALAVTGGYRGRFAWPAGIGGGSERDGLYAAANFNYLRGFMYEDDDLAIQLDTDGVGLVTDASHITIDHRHATGGNGFAIDMGVGAVIKRWEVGFGAQGLANRINWKDVEATTYSAERDLRRRFRPRDDRRPRRSAGEGASRLSGKRGLPRGSVVGRGRSGRRVWRAIVSRRRGAQVQPVRGARRRSLHFQQVEPQHRLRFRFHRSSVARPGRLWHDCQYRSETPGSDCRLDPVQSHGVLEVPNLSINSSHSDPRRSELANYDAGGVVRECGGLA